MSSHVGSTLQSFFEEQGEWEDVQARAWQKLEKTWWEFSIEERRQFLALKGSWFLRVLAYEVRLIAEKNKK